jgi:hypothetical protein
MRTAQVESDRRGPDLQRVTAEVCCFELPARSVAHSLSVYNYPIRIMMGCKEVLFHSFA